jgi:hypothetical protein
VSGAVAAAFGNRFGGSPNYTPSTSLTTPTFEGSGETTEPTWITKPSWATGVTATDLLAHNPLPSGNDDYENPSLLMSNNNGTTWSNPPALTNPIAAKPTAVGLAGNNADCYVVADVQNNRLIMFWCVFEDPTVVSGANQNGFWYSTCSATNLGTWSARALLFNHNGVNAQQTASNTEQEPKFVWDSIRGRWVLFTQDGNTQVMRMRVSATTNILGTYGAPVECSLPINGGDLIWHMDIIHEASKGRFVMVLCDSHNSGTLERQGWLASSADGLRWKVAPRPFMKANAWAVNGVYRPTIIPARDGSASYDVIVSRHQTPTARFGLVRNIPKTEIP